MESSLPSFLHTKDPDVKLPWIHRVKCELPRRMGRLAGDLPVKASYIGRARLEIEPRQQQSFVFGGKSPLGGARPQIRKFLDFECFQQIEML